MKMIKDLLAIVFVLHTVPAMAVSPWAGPTLLTQRSGFKVHEPNLHAPHLYAEKIDFVARLVDLPGANKKQSYWELSYQLYFVPEDKYYEGIRRLPRGGSNPPPEHFEGRILLIEGRIKKTRLATLKERTITLRGVAFKEKVPDAQRTKFGYLMTAYSVKIFDAQLNTTVYESGIFLTEPFEPDGNGEKQDAARRTIYLNFKVNADGTLNLNQWRPKTTSQ